MDTSRIQNQANDLGVFNSINILNENDISTFINKHIEFIKKEPYGFGRFIWKPKVIFDALENIKHGDVLVYCDAGTYININGRSRFSDYLNFMEKKSMVVFSTTSHYKCKHFVKSDAVMSYFPDFRTLNYDYFYAGCMMIKKTDESVQFVREWLELCENYHFIDRSPSYTFPESHEFQGQDTDNGLFGLCASKYIDIMQCISPYEINIYTCEGIQSAHVSNYHHSRVDWSPLDTFPFQYRRDTKKFKE
jgi:hypothetical protein